MAYVKKRNPKDKYITRVEHARGNSGFYWVRFLQTARKTHKAQLTFTDLEWGGKRKALIAARKWRDIQERELGLVDVKHPAHKRYRAKPHSNTGVTGVCRLDYIRGTGRHDTSYSVQWTQTENGERVVRTRIFGFKPDIEGSEDLAFERAVEHRKKMEKQHYIGSY